MSHASTNVVDVPFLSVVNAILRRAGRVLNHAIEQTYSLVVLAQELVSEHMSQGQSTQGTDRIAKQRVRSVKRVNEAVPVTGF